MAEGQQSSTYQLTALTTGLAERLLQDGSPKTVLNELWQFLSTDLMTANLTDVDILNVMDMVDIAFVNMLTGLPEDLWSDFRIKETVWDKDPTTGKMIAVQVRDYHIVELWDAIRAKVYIKCTNARGGHLIHTLTEQNIKQLYEERGTGPQAPGKPPGIIDKIAGWKP